MLLLCLPTLNVQLASEYNNASNTDYCEDSELEDEVRHFFTGHTSISFKLTQKNIEYFACFFILIKPLIWCNWAIASMICLIWTLLQGCSLEIRLAAFGPVIFKPKIQLTIAAFSFGKLWQACYMRKLKCNEHQLESVGVWVEQPISLQLIQISPGMK